MIRLRSIYARLLLMVLAIVMIGGALATFAAWRQARREADELFDAQLAQTAHTLLALVAHSDDDIAGEIGRGHRYQQNLLFQVWQQDDGERQLLLRSANAPRQALTELAGEGFSDGTWQGRRWRYYQVGAGRHDTRVIVGEDIALREELARGVAWQSLLPALVGLPLLALLLHLAIRRGTAPLRRLAAALGERSPERLAPVALADVPAELAPVLGALNALLDKLDSALDNERRFTADASHELRTPLAALQAQLQVANLTADPAERCAAIDKGLRGIARMSHLVDQLLTLARLEAGAQPPERETVDIAALVRDVCAEFGQAALSANAALELDAPAAAPLAARPELLAVLVRNLVDNAIRYTTAGDTVRVRVIGGEQGVDLSVRDAGPGVAPEHLAHLGARFHRFGEAGPDGVGLGLSIVRRIAELHGGTVLFENAQPGLRASVRLPACGSEKPKRRQPG